MTEVITAKVATKTNDKMNPLRANKDNQKLYLQRNILLLIAGTLLLSNLLLVMFIFTKKERTIIIPVLQEEVSITGGEFSESYTEQMTIFFVELLLDLTPENIKYKSQVLLRHAAPESHHNLLAHYKEEETRYKKYRLATKFDITGMKVLDKGTRVEIIGLLSSRFGEDSLKQKQVVYEAKYKKVGGRLLLLNFAKKEEDK